MSENTTPDSNPEYQRVAAKRQAERAKRMRLRSRDEVRKRNLIRTVIIGVGLLVLGGLLFDGDTSVQREVFAQVAAFCPPVDIFLKSVKTRRTAEIHEKVASGDIVYTGSGGRANIRFPDETIVKVGSNAVFNVVYTRYSRTQGARERGFFLRYGRLWARVRKFISGNSDFTVETPTALAAVRGTRLSVMVSRQDGTTTISVQDGVVAVTVKGLNAPPVLVNAGQQLTVRRRMKTAPRPVAMGAAETQAWKQEKADTLGPDADVLAEAPGELRQKSVDLEEQFVVKPVANLAALFHIDRLSGGHDDAPPTKKTGTPQNGGQPFADAMKLAQDQAKAAERSLQDSLKQARHTPDALQPSLERALRAARAFQVALASNDDYPENIGLSDLAGLQADEKTMAFIRESIAALVKYEKHPDGYVAVVRALPPSGALIEIHPDSIKVLGNMTP